MQTTSLFRGVNENVARQDRLRRTASDWSVSAPKKNNYTLSVFVYVTSSARRLSAADSALSELLKQFRSYDGLERAYAKVEGNRIRATLVANNIDSDSRLDIFDKWLAVEESFPSVTWDFDLIDRRGAEISMPDGDSYRIVEL